MSKMRIFIFLNLISLFRHAGPELEAMKVVALSAKNRSLSDFQAAVKTFKAQLEEDLIVSKHLDSLYSSMLEQNLCRLTLMQSLLSEYSTLQTFQNHRALQQGPGGLRGRQDRAAQGRGREEALTDDSRQEVPRHPRPGDRGPRHLHVRIKVKSFDQFKQIRSNNDIKDE